MAAEIVLGHRHIAVAYPGDQPEKAIETDEIEQAEAERRAAATLEEEGAVKSWLKRIEEAREFDKGARKGNAKDRTHCQGQASNDVYDVRRADRRHLRRHPDHLSVRA